MLVAKPRKKKGRGRQLKFFSIFIARVLTTFESRKAISTVIVIETREGRKILLIQLPRGSKLFSLVVLIKRERVTRDDSFFLFPAFPLSPVKLIRKRKSEIVFN